MLTETLLATAPAPVPLTVGGHTFRMVPVRGGSFDMGDEHGDLWDACRPVHRVQLDDFWIGQFPVTQALWRAVVESPETGPRRRSKTRRGSLDPDPSFFKGDHRPVERVPLYDIQVFLKKLNLLLPGWNFRLPTEAEWEYAARGGHVAHSEGVTASHPLTMGYAGSEQIDAVAWWHGNSNAETHEVGLKQPNALGLFDMSGNVYEWCEDWYDRKFYEKCLIQGVVENPLNTISGSGRVLRGGSWDSFPPQECLVAYRYAYGRLYRNTHVGFRLASSPPVLVAGS